MGLEQTEQAGRHTAVPKHSHIPNTVAVCCQGGAILHSLPAPSPTHAQANAAQTTVPQHMTTPVCLAYRQEQVWRFLCLGLIYGTELIQQVGGTITARLSAGQQWHTFVLLRHCK